MWFVTALSLTGVVLNIYKKPVCFAVWAVTNVAWMIYDISLGAYSQAAMFGVYLVTSLWGLWKWQREARLYQCLHQPAAPAATTKEEA